MPVPNGGYLGITYHQIHSPGMGRASYHPTRLLVEAMARSGEAIGYIWFLLLFRDFWPFVLFWVLTVGVKYELVEPLARAR